MYLLFDGATGALVRLSGDSYRSWLDYLSPAPSPPSAEPAELCSLVAAGLFARPRYPDGPATLTGLHSLCLNVAHSCDLSCRYCFAGAGRYGGERELMSQETAIAAVEYLLENAPAGRVVNIDFFGGEPLLAWDAVTAAVACARRSSALDGRSVHFTLTTNGVQMDRDRAAFCAEHMSTIIVSVDGRPEVHDRMRLSGGGGSYRAAVAGLELLKDALERRGRTADSAGERPDRPAGSGPLWVRGTYTAHNLDFWRDVEHLARLGHDQISMEPVSAGPEAAYALRPEHLPRIRASYERIAELAAATGLRFFHFELNQPAPACAPKRYTGCAAGAGYACVSPDGRLWPCHQFDGRQGFELGEVTTVGGSTRYSGSVRLAANHVGAKPICRSCWAQLFCGGGCHFAALSYGRSLDEPWDLACAITRTRLEPALALLARRGARPQS